jgi:hypothetical protein
MAPRPSTSIRGSTAGKQPATQNVDAQATWPMALADQLGVAGALMGALLRHLGMYHQSSFWCNQFGSAFRLMNSSTDKPSINAGRGTRFCLPLIKIVINFSLRWRRSRFSAEVREP